MKACHLRSPSRPAAVVLTHGTDLGEVRGPKIVCCRTVILRGTLRETFLGESLGALVQFKEHILSGLISRNRWNISFFHMLFISPVNSHVLARTRVITIFHSLCGRRL